MRVDLASGLGKGDDMFNGVLDDLIDVIDDLLDGLLGLL